MSVDTDHAPASPRKLGREAILEAAATLMDERGVDQVSLNEISAASGHRNRSAVNYHFGSREAVIRELVTQTMVILDAERNALLDHLEATTRSLGERAVLEVVIGPLARQLRTAEGRRYLRLCGQLIGHPRYGTGALRAATINRSMERCLEHLAPALAAFPDQIAAERTSQIAGFVVRALADEARLLDIEPPPRPVLTLGAFTTNLVDVALGGLFAPSSILPDDTTFKGRGTRKSAARPARAASRKGGAAAQNGG